MADWLTIGAARIACCDYREALAELQPGDIDHVICDPPFSQRTHDGHDTVSGLPAGDPGYDGADRKPLGYTAWTPADAREFVKLTHSVCDGWLVVMSDYTLMKPWCDAMQEVGRYVFAPLPYYAPGSRVRLSGDGPSSWTDWIVVSRTAKQHRWGTLPGGYMPKANYGMHERMGGKPLGLMRELVRDYSKPGDVVADFVMGAGTTLAAALQLGRRAIGVEIDPAAFAKARQRLEQINGSGSLFERRDNVDLFSEMDHAGSNRVEEAVEIQRNQDGEGLSQQARGEAL